MNIELLAVPNTVSNKSKAGNTHQFCLSKAKQTNLMGMHLKSYRIKP